MLQRKSIRELKNKRELGANANELLHAITPCKRRLSDRRVFVEWQEENESSV